MNTACLYVHYEHCISLYRVVVMGPVQVYTSVWQWYVYIQSAIPAALKPQLATSRQICMAGLLVIAMAVASVLYLYLV